MIDQVKEYVNRSPFTFTDTKTALKFRSTEELRFSMLIFSMFKSPATVNLLANLTLFFLKIKLPIEWIIKRTIFRQFCGGTSMSDCDATIEKLGSHNVGSILDYSVEAAQKEADFDKTRDELLRILDRSKGDNNIPFGCLKMTGLIKVDVLQKVTEEKELTPDEQKYYLKGLKRLESVCQRAYDNGTRLFIDAEESWIQGAIDKMAESMMAKYNKEKAVVYTTLQMYRHDRIAYLKEMIAKAQQQGFVLGVKFVRGAYLDKENERAKELGYPTPMQPNKQATDHDFNVAMVISLDNKPYISICAGTHNEDSCIYLTELMRERGIAKDDPTIYFSQLYGMSDNISFILAQEGYNVAKYLPYGPVKFTMPYLVRRAQENTAVSGEASKELRLISKELKRRKQEGEL